MCIQKGIFDVMDENLMMANGKSEEILTEIPDNSVDSIVCDPPYALSFMGKDWDKTLPDIKVWQECIRVLKPGGYLVAMSASRTYHRLAVQLEDLGLICHPMIGWIYGSGFPKATDLSKQFDKAAGVEREVIGYNKRNERDKKIYKGNNTSALYEGGIINREKALETTAPTTDQAKKWNGYKYGLQALKPALEPIAVFQKPHLKPMIKNVEKWGCGAMNIDACRAECKTKEEKEEHKKNCKRSGVKRPGFLASELLAFAHPQGRHPANILLDGSEVVEEEFLKQGGIRTSGASNDSYIQKESENKCMSGKNYERKMQNREKDSGSASRFFNKLPITDLDAPFLYCAKASKRERNKGLETKDINLTKHDARPQDWENANWKLRGGNHHPTVKPIALMEWLIKLVTPEGGTTLDPFMGSGTTGIAAKRNGFKFIGIEMNEEYFEIACKRIDESNS